MKRDQEAAGQDKVPDGRSGRSREAGEAAALSPSRSILQMQRLAGNQAVAGRLSSRQPVPVQRLDSQAVMELLSKDFPWVKDQDLAEALGSMFENAESNQTSGEVATDGTTAGTTDGTTADTAATTTASQLGSGRFSRSPAVTRETKESDLSKMEDELIGKDPNKPLVAGVTKTSPSDLKAMPDVDLDARTSWLKTKKTELATWKQQEVENKATFNQASTDQALDSILNSKNQTPEDKALFANWANLTKKKKNTD